MLVIFDLDGTLLNTVADLAASTNHALECCGFPTHPVEAYNYFVGNGINKLFERALPENARTQENILRIREKFLPYYNLHKADLTKPYPGITELLDVLQQKNIKIAVASNKYQEGTAALMEKYFPRIRFSAVFGQREGIPVKPDPQIVHDILTQTGCSKQETLFVGDSAVDMQTAHNSGVISIGVTWGFRPRTELEAEQPDHIANTTDELLDIIWLQFQRIQKTNRL